MNPKSKGIKRIPVLNRFCLLLLFPLSLCVSQGSRPNIIFIMSDDHAENAISAYGSALIETPNIDRLATEGVRFDNSFVTNSICAPSRAVLLTGKYSHINGLRDNRDEFDGSQVTFPKLLQKAGYQTFIVGKWHLKTDPTGFDTWQILVGQGQYYNPVFIENGQETHYTGYTTDIITDKALEVLEGRDPSKPFCLLLHHKAPHRNWMPDTKHLTASDDAIYPIPETLVDDYAGRPGAAAADMRIDNMYLSFDLKLNRGSYEKETGTGGKASFAVEVEDSWQKTLERLTPEQRKAWDAYYDRINETFKNARLSGRDLLEWKYQRYMNDYLLCVRSVDENIGRLLDYLDKSGLAANTIVVYTSDQGFYLGEHGWYDKRFMYEESLSMPLLIRYPVGIKAGGESEKIVLNLDFAPTFLDYAGVAIPADMQGRSLRPLLSGQSPGDWRNSMYYHYYEYPHGWHNVKRHYGVRTERFKLINFYDESNGWELYDLRSDPHELRNVYGMRGYEEVANDLTAELHRLQKLYGDNVIPGEGK